MNKMHDLYVLKAIFISVEYKTSTLSEYCCNNYYSARTNKFKAKILMHQICFEKIEILPAFNY